MRTNSQSASTQRGRWSADLFNSFTAAVLTVLSAQGLVGTGAFAEPAGYEFKLVAALGDPLPGGRNFINDFEPGAINNRGDFLTGADTGIGEGERVRVTS